MTRLRANPVDHWPELIDHINRTWEKRKGRKYPFTGKDFKLLKTMCRWATAFEVMALWRIYLDRSPFWGARTGFLVEGMFPERSVLMDDPDFKRLTAAYEKESGMKEPKQVALDLGLEGKSV